MRCCFWEPLFCVWFLSMGLPDTASVNTILETETVRDMEGREAVNQSGVLPAAKMTQEESKEEYFLVSEAGFLLVFCSDKSTICLYTHIPVTDFPERERARLMEGIWFPSMMDVYHYLESYTS